MREVPLYIVAHTHSAFYNITVCLFTPSLTLSLCGRARSGQRNFQLIVITHDMAFIELLSRSGYTDCYYRVSKEVG